MSKYKEIYGVDISKDVFDVYGEKSGHHQFKNGEKGIGLPPRLDVVPVLKVVSDLASEAFNVYMESAAKSMCGFFLRGLCNR